MKGGVLLDKGYDNGQRDIFFCLAVNLMDIDDLNSVIDDANNFDEDMGLNDKSDLIKQMLTDLASRRGIALMLRKGKW